MTHVFYWGLHPVSWFILIMNVAIGIMEWKFVASRMAQINTNEEEPKP